MTYIFEYDIVPGKTAEFFEFMEREGGKFWTQFEEVEKYEIFSKMGGTPAYEAHVEISGFDSFNKIRMHPGWDKVAAKTSVYTMNTQRRFLLPHVSYN